MASVLNCEFTIPRELVEKIGGGSVEAGHRKLDAAVAATNEARRKSEEAWDAMTPAEQAAFIAKHSRGE